MKLIQKLFMLLVFTSIVSAQVTVIKKEYAENKLTYKIQTNSNYFVKNLGDKNKIIFSDYMDESKPGELSLPSHDIFLAIPPKTAPSVKFTIIEQIQINGLPDLNPDVKIHNEEFIYSKSQPKKNILKKVVENNGTLWIDDNFCIHLKINPFIYSSKKKLLHVEKLELSLLFTDNIVKNNGSSLEDINEAILDKELAKQILGKPNYSKQNTTNWIDFTKSYLKLGTAKDGIYRLDVNDLENNGINVSSINPKTFKLYLKGKEIPIFVEGENDLSFSQTDFIEFAGMRNMGGNHHEISPDGEPYNEYLGRYTDTTFYWLGWDGEEGKRVQVFNGEFSETADTLSFYSKIDHYEVNRWYDFATPNQVEREKPFWTSNKTWHEGNINVGIRNKNFSVNEVYPNEFVKLSIKLQDFASDISTNSHRFSLSINSTNIWSDSTYIDKYKMAVLSTQLNSNLLTDGNNVLKINSIQTNASINLCIFDWYEIEYSRNLIPIDSSLIFTFPFLNSNEVKNVKLQNITNDNFSIWKFGDTYKKIELSRIDDQLIFADTISTTNKYAYFQEDIISAPKIYYKKQFKNLRSANNKADYLAISHKNFKTKVNEYVEFIEEEYGVVTKTIYIEDIYDEFSYGFFNPEAIKEFLKSTHQYWQTPNPKYVALIGGATYDYYGNKFQNINSVTERVINYVPSFGAPVSDNWFVSWDTTGAYIPQMNIGRIPVTTNTELDWYLEKHKNYRSQIFSDWNKRYLFFSSGDAKNASELSLLYEANKFVIDNYVTPKPIGGLSSHFYKTVEPKSNFGPISVEEFQTSIDNGAVFISYLGHSGTQIWDNSITSPLQLKNNKNMYPIVSDFGCSTGKFAEAEITSFSELFTIGEDGQAISYVGNSSLGFLSTAALMPKLFYKKILKEKYFNVSEALKEAKIEMLQNYGSSGVYELFALTNTLIGDPIISLPIPEKPNYVINNLGIFLENNLVNDLQDSIKLKFPFNNYGTVLNDSIKILITHIFNNISESRVLKLPTPSFEDSFAVNFPIKNKPGNHTIEILLDSEEKIDELNETDNSTIFSFNVASSLIRPKLDYQIVNGVDDLITFLNPSQEPSNDIITLEIAEEPNFNAIEKFELSFDSLSTTFNAEALLSNKRYWGRAKINGNNNYSTPFSFVKSAAKYYLGDSLSFSKSNLDNVINHKTQVALDTQIVNFNIFSAGFDDGQAALLSRDGVNYVPRDGVGHHLALFNSEAPFEFVSYYYFNTYAGGENITDYIQFLDTLSSKFLVTIAISDEGSPKSDELKNQIKSLGSKYIDSVGFRSSWAILGQKGAAIGSIPEVFSLAGTGSVNIDTNFSYRLESGNVLTALVGPSTKWNIFNIHESLPNNSAINYYPVLISDNTTNLDTLNSLNSLNLIDGIAILTHIDAKQYPYIKIFAEFEAGDNNTSPELYSLGVDYVGVPELATNYQVVSIESDTLQQGEDANISFYVYNVGESTADSFNVRVDVIKPDNTKEQIYSTIVDSLGSEQRKKLYVAYNTTAFNGERTFSIIIDSEDKILELYEDNNFYSIPFYVIGDTTKPSMNLTFNGNDIFDGEYISSQPQIKIELSDPSLIPITDTSSIDIFLNNSYVNYSGNEDNLSINYSESNPKVTVNFAPTLEDGEYTIRVFGKDASGNIGDSSGITKSFNVQSDAKLLNVYNYPNPFSTETYFTFKLTQIPDEIKIKVFTVAGRLIKEIILNSSQLSYDLNKVYWDGRDDDGDLLGNGVYLYKVIMDVEGKKQDVTQKLAVVRK
jgi:Peptidase family C25/Interleukin-like EMT inducer/CARDB